MNIALEMVIAASSGIIGAVGAYVKLKSKVDLVAAENIAQEKEINDLRERKKEMNAALHKRVDDIRDEMNDVTTKFAQGQQEMKTNLAQMELRIVDRIQQMVKEITKKD